MANTGLGKRVAILMFALFGAWFAAAGFLASDDTFYADAALGWLNDFPYVGESHWSLRQTLVLPLAVLFGVAGPSEVILLSVSTLYYAALLLLCFLWLRSRVGSASAWLLVVLASSVPGFAALAGTANVDVVETFFMLGSLLAFMKCRDSAGSEAVRWLFLAGILVGLAFLSRATAVTLMVVYGVLFLQGRYHARSRYLIMGAGAALVYLLDTLYYLVLTGDPLHRLHSLTETHIEGVAQTVGTGNLMEGTVAEPFMAILINNEFGLTFFAAVFVFIVWNRFRDRETTRDLAEWMGLLLVVAVAQFVVVGFLMGLRPLPRYFSFAFIPALMMLAVGLAFLWQQHGRLRLVAGAVTLTLVCSGLALTDLTNRDPLFEARHLVQTKQQFPELGVAAAQRTCNQANSILRLQGVHRPGADVCSPKEQATLLLMSSMEEGSTPPSSLCTLRRFEPTHTLLGRGLEALNLSSFVPRRVITAGDSVVLMSRGGCENSPLEQQ